MPYADPVAYRAYQRAYYLAHREELCRRSREWNLATDNHCVDCGSPIGRNNTRCAWCRTVGPRNGRWIDGRTINAGGYVEVNVGPHQRQLEHRLVMEQLLGRLLVPTEQVHHINENRADNRGENLALCNKLATHKAVHSGEVYLPC